MPPKSTVVVVTYATHALDLTWVPGETPVIVVRNDTQPLDVNAGSATIQFIEAGGNIGFGAAVNRALPEVTTTRVILANPDLSLDRRHFDALDAAMRDEVVTVPLVDPVDRMTVVLSRYPTALTHLMGGLRAGRIAPLGSRRRRAIDTLTSPAGSAGAISEGSSLPLSEFWVSGALISIDTERLLSVGGFDSRFFLYYEDIDLCRRLAQRFPQMQARVATSAPGHHGVGASAKGDPRGVELHRLGSAILYARSQEGARWRACGGLLSCRKFLLERYG
jgi:GT2 family glycosyltransferase